MGQCQLTLAISMEEILMKSSLRSPAQVEGTQGFLSQLKKDLEIPPSLRDGALLFPQGLDSNPETTLKTPQGA